MVRKAANEDPGHVLVRCVNALATLISQCEAEGVGKVGRRELLASVVHVTGRLSARNKPRTGSPAGVCG